MNLAQATTLSQLAMPVPIPVKEQKKSARRVALDILARCEKGGYPYKHFPTTLKGAEAWAHKFLSSKHFVLTRINLNAAASPHNPRDPKRVEIYKRQIMANVENAKKFDPIVVDVNRRKVGRSHLGYVPDIIVTDGKHRKKSMLAMGITEHWAWVGKKALKKMQPKDIKAHEVFLPPVDGTKIASQYEMMCSTTPALNIATPRQDTGAGGSRPHDQVHSEKTKKVKANGLCACEGAVSTGQLAPPDLSDMKVPPDHSDAGSRTDASDQRKWMPNTPQVVPSGANPGNADRFGLNKAAAYANNIGPRVINKGASRSEMSRILSCESAYDASGNVKPGEKIHAGGPGSGPHKQAMDLHNKLVSQGWRLVNGKNKPGWGDNPYIKSGENGIMNLQKSATSASTTFTPNRNKVNAAKTIPKMWTKKKKGGK